jgi:hypothetical protein
MTLRWEQKVPKDVHILVLEPVMRWPPKKTLQKLGVFLLYFGGSGTRTQGLHLEPLHQSFFVLGFLK